MHPEMEVIIVTAHASTENAVRALNEGASAYITKPLNMTGDRLSKALMEILPEIPVILCTGFSERITEWKAKETGIRGFAMKPLSIHELSKITREVLDG